MGVSINDSRKSCEHKFGIEMISFIKSSKSPRPSKSPRITGIPLTMPLSQKPSVREMHNKIVAVPTVILTMSRSEEHRASLPPTFQKKRTPIRRYEETTSSTMDCPELQRSSRDVLNIWESADNVRASHKSVNKSRLGKIANTLIPLRDTMINISMRGQNRGGSANINVPDNGARQNRCLVSTVATEVCETPEYSMEFDIMTHRNSTFQHAERILGSSSTRPHTPPSPRYHDFSQYLNEESMRHLSAALNDFEKMKVGD